MKRILGKKNISLVKCTKQQKNRTHTEKKVNRITRISNWQTRSFLEICTKHYIRICSLWKYRRFLLSFSNLILCEICFVASCHFFFFFIRLFARSFDVDLQQKKKMKSTFRKLRDEFHRCAPILSGTMILFTWRSHGCFTKVVSVNKTFCVCMWLCSCVSFFFRSLIVCVLLFLWSWAAEAAEMIAFGHNLHQQLDAEQERESKRHNEKKN